MALWGLIGNDRQMATTTYQGRESVSDRATRREAERSATRRRNAKRSVASDAASGGGEAFADRSARSTTRWYRGSRGRG
ncbi:hypothetical protein [Streptomyces triticirhizae]|uniref:Uncharacterized protein n=1 Tax=Streptomyces triticirhizae TaxID=2483353 RepID=A0A3M2M4D7_9ACTN|nr:hypothetical protein [Streptomyces triticirhizae]RMI44416.1 hypothetical protein EBN88_05290 [Streptomyces triticirhizae]